MKISRFRKLSTLITLAACVWSSSGLAGELARARAKLVSPADTVAATLPPDDDESVTIATGADEAVVEVAARPRVGAGTPTTAHSATRYVPAQSPTSTAATGDQRPTSTLPVRPYVVTPGTTSAAAAAVAPIPTPVPRVITSSESATSSPETSSRRDDARRTYHNALRPEAVSTSPAAGPTVISGSPGDSQAEAAGKAAIVAAEEATTAPQASVTEGAAKTETVAKQTAEKSQMPQTTENPKSAPTAKPELSKSEPSKLGRASDVAPIRTADPSQPGRLPALVGEREPGEPDHEQKMTIGRTPADDKTKQLFESKESKPLTPELEILKKRVQTALALYYQNWTLNTNEHSPWEVMHAIIAFGVDTRLRTNGGRETTTAIGHLCYSGICRNQPILTIRNGELYALRGPGVQGHPGQFLAILAQSYLQRDYPLYVGGEKYTLEDLIKAEMRDCEAGTELTFKLISLMHYLPSDAAWTNFQGQPWSLDRLVREEIVQPIRGAACGGTHRLMGLSYAIRKREQRGESIDGIYLEAKKYIDQYHKYTFSLQNPDGSFSTAWFVRREARNDIDRRMQTTGHILEWLAFSLSDEQLRDPRVVKAVKYVSDILLNEHYTQWEVGHLGHGLHALQIYNERVFGGEVRSFDGLLSRKPSSTSQSPATRAR